MKLTNFFLVGMIIMIFGCSSSKMYDKTYRTNELRKTYPPKITSQKEVHEKFNSKPVLSEKRPNKGWRSHQNKYLFRKIKGIKDFDKIILVERYLIPDSRSSFDFSSLCNVWFYYDNQKNVIDVEWEWHTD